MAIVCNGIDLVALRHIRQKRFAKIKPAFDAKYGQNYDTWQYWYSQSDDESNGIYLSSYNVGITSTTNFQIAMPDAECFHVQEYDQFYPKYAYYVSDYPANDIQGETTLTCGVSLRFNDGYYLLTRDKPWEKYGISWYCSTTLKTQESTLTSIGGSPLEPIYYWSDWSTIATDSNNYYHQIDPTSIGNVYESNSLYVPPQTTSNNEGPNGPVPYKRTRYLGSISVYSISIYRRGAYHHA
jgi:hypothetical protein